MAVRETSASASASASGSEPTAAIARRSRARRCRNEPSKRDWRRSGAYVIPRDGQPSRSGQTSQRGVRAMHTSRPRSKRAWFHSYARPGGGTTAVPPNARPSTRLAFVSGAAIWAPKAKHAIAAAV